MCVSRYCPPIHHQGHKAHQGSTKIICAKRNVFFVLSFVSLVSVVVKTLRDPEKIGNAVRVPPKMGV
jgi:hypothetical protein